MSLTERRLVKLHPLFPAFWGWEESVVPRLHESEPGPGDRGRSHHVGRIRALAHLTWFRTLPVKFSDCNVNGCDWSDAGSM
jgi:hypothetical protein